MLALALAAATISLHSAKVQTYSALLRITEQRPDVINATGAGVRVGRCSRVHPGWRCRGSLDPVLIDAIPTELCYRVRVRPARRARVTDADC